MPESGTGAQTDSDTIYGLDPRKAIFGIFALALILRFIFLIQNISNPLLYMPVLDEAYYIRLGRAIAGGFILGERGVFFMDPLYGYFLGVIFFVLGWLPGQDSLIMSVRLIQILADSAAVFLIYRLTCLVWNKEAGFWAALLWAGYKVAFFYSLLILKATFTPIFLMAFTLLMISTAEQDRPGRWFILGALGGVMVFLRANLLLVAPFGMIAWIIIKRPPIRKAAINCALVTAGLMVALSIGAARNWAAAGEWIFLNSQSGRLLFASNNPENLTGLYLTPSFSRKGPEEMEADFHTEAERRLGRELTSRQASSYWTRQTLKFIVNNPASAAQAIWNKLIKTIGAPEIPVNRSLQSSAQFSSIARAPLPNFALALALGAPGLLAGIYYRRDLLWLAPAVGTTLATVLIFYTCSRFRFPMVPFLLVGAGISITLVTEWIRNGKWIPTVFISAAAVVMAALSMSVEGQYYKGDEKYFLAKAYWNVGDLASAAKVASKSAREFPGESRFLVLQGMVALSAKEFAMAATINRQALQMNPADSDAMNNLGLSLTGMGDYVEAVNWLDRAYKANRKPISLYAMAVALEKKGDSKAAAKAYLKYIETEKPGSPFIIKAKDRIRAMGRIP